MRLLVVLLLLCTACTKQQPLPAPEDTAVEPNPRKDTTVIILPDQN